MNITKTRRELTPADVTKELPAFRSGRLEAWQAASRDGIWRYDRLEIAGTPWVAVHLPSGTEGNWYGTLTAARAATADGSALAFVERKALTMTGPQWTGAAQVGLMDPQKATTMPPFEGAQYTGHTWDLAAGTRLPGGTEAEEIAAMAGGAA